MISTFHWFIKCTESPWLSFDWNWQQHHSSLVFLWPLAYLNILLLILSFEKVENQVLRVVALRSVTDPHAFWTILFLDDFKRFSILEFETWRLEESVCLILTSLDFVDGFKLERSELKSGELDFLLGLGALRFEFFEVKWRDVLCRVVERSWMIGKKVLGDWSRWSVE